jgi:hypothetical protein
MDAALRRMAMARMTATVILLLFAGGVTAEERRAASRAVRSDHTAASDAIGEYEGEPPPVDQTRHRVSLQPVRPASKASPGPEIAYLKDARMLRLRKGEALARIDGRERLLRPGDVVGTDVVKEVGEDAIIFVRPETSGDPRGSALIVWRQGSDGRGRVRVFWSKNHLSAPPEVK